MPISPALTASFRWTFKIELSESSCESLPVLMNALVLFILICVLFSVSIKVNSTETIILAFTLLFWNSSSFTIPQYLNFWFFSLLSFASGSRSKRHQFIAPKKLDLPAPFFPTIVVIFVSLVKSKIWSINRTRILELLMS